MDNLWGDDRTNPAAFLVRAWNVATLPVMSPATSASAPTSAPSGSLSPRGTAAPWPSSGPPSSTVGSPGGVRAPYAGGEDNQNVEEPITT